jgi:hypothetical protein
MESATQARFHLSSIAATTLSTTSSAARGDARGNRVPLHDPSPMLSDLLLCLIAAGVLAGQQERLDLVVGLKVVMATGCHRPY